MQTIDQVIESMGLTAAVNAVYRAQHEDALHYLRLYRAEHRKDPLSWSDLMLSGLIGKPVWDAEKRRWYLIVDSALDNDAWCDLVDDCGKIHHLTELDFRRGGWRLFREKRMTEV